MYTLYFLTTKICVLRGYMLLFLYAFMISYIFKKRNENFRKNRKYIKIAEL